MRWDTVIGSPDRQVRPSHLQSSLSQTGESLRRRHLVHQVQIYVQQGGRNFTLGHNVVIPDLFDDRARLARSVNKRHKTSYSVRGRSAYADTALALKLAHTAFPTSVVVAGLPAGFRSAVTRPPSKTSSIARFTAVASACKPKLYSNIAAIEPIAPSGLALF